MSPHQLNYGFIKGLEPEGEVGCIIQCSLEYPVALYDYHSDYPLAPIKKLIPYSMLSPIAKMICDKHKLKRTTNVEKLLATENYIGKPNFKNATRINSKLVGVEMKYSSIKINKPFYIGMSILDLSKWHMYNFHYNVMKPIFGNRVHLLYTDSFIYEISCADVCEELRPHARDYLDFSNYPESHMLKNSCNKKVPRKFKDESASKCITEFVGLRSKMYSFMLDDKKDVSKAEVSG